jgi:hypothetical protein
MNIDDALVDSTIWNCIEESSAPDDFKSYLEHRTTNAAHIEESDSCGDEF